MQSGVYRKIVGRTGVGELYEFVCLSRHHTTGEELVTYIPLRVEPAWAGTVRHCTLERDAFDLKFVWIGEGLPGPRLAASELAKLVETGNETPPPNPWPEWW